MSAGPLVSVIVPTRNRPDTLPTALRSVLDQTYPHLDVIVVDDGSTPPAEVRLAPPSPRIRVVRFDERRGGAAAKNEGLRQAAGDFVSFLDDDDYCFPGKVETQLAFLQAHPEIDLVFSQIVVRHADGTRGFRLPDDYRHDPIENLRLYNVIHTNSALFRRGVAARVRFDERLTRFTDTQFFLAAALQCTAHFLPGEVAVWNHHGRDERMTQPDLLSTYRNFKLLCTIFEEPLAAHPAIGQDYQRSLRDLELRALHALF